MASNALHRGTGHMYGSGTVFWKYEWSDYGTLRVFRNVVALALHTWRLTCPLTPPYIPFLDPKHDPYTATPIFSTRFLGYIQYVSSAARNVMSISDLREHLKPTLSGDPLGHLLGIP